MPTSRCSSPLDLTVIIKCRNDPRVAATVASVPAKVPVIVVAGPGDPSRHLLETDVRVTFIDPDTEDLGAKVNAGIDAAQTNRVLIMDADSTFRPHAVERIAEALDHAMIARCLIAFAPGRRWAPKAIARWRDAENNRQPAPAYTPGLGIDLSVRGHVGWPLFPEGVGFSHDAAFDQLLDRSGIHAILVPDAVVVHEPISLFHFLRSGYRTGRGTARQTALGLRVHQERFIWILTRAMRGRFIAWFVKNRRECGSSSALLGAWWIAAYRVGYHAERLRWLAAQRD